MYVRKNRALAKHVTFDEGQCWVKPMTYHNEGFLESTQPPEDEVSVERPAVLIVDDRPANLIALEAVLDRLAVRIVRAHSGEEALVRSAKQEFAVILLDWRMPRLDGIETARLMRERDPARQPPVMILTAHLPELVQVKTAYAAGVVDFLQKPYAPEVLAAKVSAASLRRWRLTRPPCSIWQQLPCHMLQPSQSTPSVRT